MTMNDSDLNRSASSPSSSPPSPLPTPTFSSIPSVNKSSQEEVETPDGSSPTASSSSLVNDVLSYLVWPCIILLPLVLTFNNMYKHVFPSEWYNDVPTDFWNNSKYPSPLGLSLGLFAVVVGQFFMLGYFVLRRGDGTSTNLTAIQKEGARPYDVMEGVVTHLAQPEGFVMLGGYLTIYWMSGFMPASYYSFSGGIIWKDVFAQLLFQDLVQYIMHVGEHEIDKLIFKNVGVKTSIYPSSHKPHHRFTNPRLFDAFNGSPTDTFLMILVPLFITAQLVHTNVWTYMTFGSLYANWLSLIHAEYAHPWDRLFRAIGFGTAADHHVHHKLFKYNFGHTFMYWDRMFGTYRDPCDVSVFSKGV